VTAYAGKEIAGPRVEAESIYVAPSRLETRLREGGDPLVLFDVGLGAATNAISAWQVSEAQSASARRLDIVSFEHDLDALKLALHPEHADALGLTKDGANAHAAATALLTAGRHETSRTRWRLCLGDFVAALAAMPAAADIVFWDLFSPRTAPALWTVAMFAPCGACAVRVRRFIPTARRRRRGPVFTGGVAVVLRERMVDEREEWVEIDAKGVARPLGESWLCRLERSSMPLPPDVPTDPLAQADALARVRASPQFAA
jgi:hypothetical protein